MRRMGSDAAGGSLWLRFLSGPDIDALGIANGEIIAAVQDAVRAHGDGQVVVEPRVHLVPDNDGAGHFNVLRGHLSQPGVSGIKVVGDFVSNYAAGLPSELGLLTLYDTADEVFDGADILVEASRLSQPEPLLRTAVVKPGAFVVPYGTISAVELDLLDVMDKVVVDDWREAQSGRFGALRPHVDSGRLSPGTLHAELGQIVAGQRPGRERDEERILLWHRGLAILDIAVGLAILRRAEDQGAGTMLRYR